MKVGKSIKADSTGRINLGKKCAGCLFTLSKEKGKIVLEPALIVSEREFRSNELIGSVILDDNEWSKFQEIMESDDEPNDHLRRLMKDSQ